MSTTLLQLEPQVANRLEETYPTIFWNTPNELRPTLVEAMNEATIISGEPEIIVDPSYPITLNSTEQPMPTNCVAISRIEGPTGAILKTFVKDLDHLLYPGWESDSDQSLGNPGVLQFWFPIGLGQFGVYPQLATALNVVVMGVGLPVAEARPYSGNETIPFQEEYNEAFVRYASSVLRLKEGGADFMDGLRDYEYFLSKAQELSKYAVRKHSVRFTRGVGHQAEVNRREQD